MTNSNSNFTLRPPSPGYVCDLLNNSYYEYQSFELPLDSYAGTAYVNNEIIIESNLNNRSDYRDKKIIDRHKLTSAIALPIPNKSGDTKQGIGVICLYPNKMNYIEESYLSYLQECIGYAYLHALDSTKISARERLVAAISKSSDLNSALHRIIHSLKEYLSFEAGSIFLYEEKVKRLQLHTTTGISSDLYKHDIVYSKKDRDTPTWKVFTTGNTMILPSNEEDGFSSEKYLENVVYGSKSMLILPISRKDKTDSRRERQGVLRCKNKILSHNSDKEVISFSCEDVEILRYVSDIIGLTFHMFLHRENQISYFERIMHGTKSNIQTSIQNLELLERRGELKANISHDLLFAIYDTREWLEDIKNQMERIERSQLAIADRKKIRVGSLLINSVRLFQKSAESRGINKPEITNLKNEGFFGLPFVIGDEKLLMLVFRNIIENALKYRNLNNNKCKVDIKHSFDEEFVNISFTDYGIGIPESDMSEVFDEGFRSENAASQDPAGTGLGLTQSRDAMRTMKGDLILDSCNPVRLLVKIKRA